MLPAMPDTHKDPLVLHGKPQVLDAQRAVNAAWARVRHTARIWPPRGRPPAERRERPALRPWTPEDNDEIRRAACRGGGCR